MGKKEKLSRKEQQGGQKKKALKPKPKSTQEFHTTYKKMPSEIGNKQKRVEVNYKRRAIKAQLQMKERKERKQLPPEQRQQPITIEDKQEAGEEFIDDYD